MFCVSVDNRDFWREENEECGRQQHRSLSEVTTTTDRGMERAGLVEEVDWVEPVSRKPLLVERRAITVFASAGLKATLVVWRCRLQTPPGKDVAVLQPAVTTPVWECGWSHRWIMLVGSSTPTTSRARSSAATNGLRRRSGCDYTADVDGKPVTVAIFDRPADVRCPTGMFTMAKPFAFMSATQSGWQNLWPSRPATRWTSATASPCGTALQRIRW